MKKRLLFIPLIAALAFVSSGCSKSKSETPNNCVANTTGIPTSAEIASLQKIMVKYMVS